MRRRIHYTVCLLFATLNVFSQANFKGKVLNGQSNDPIAGASVYFNNTSYGTTSNASGEFSLSLPAINLQLIVSSVGYEPIVYNIKPEEVSQSLYVFRLEVKEEMLQDILLLPDATRKKYIRLFTENFLGITEEASRSRMENLKSVYFTNPGNAKGSFKAYCDTPILIVNKMLGYHIYFQLLEFSYNEQTKSSSFYGFTRFEEMGDRRKWKKNREKVYYGSTLHFYRSLISNKLEENFYKIFVVREDTIKTATETHVADMAIPATATQVIRPDSLNPNNFIVTWKKKLMVQYNKDPASKYYLAHNLFLEGNMTHGYRAYLTVVEPPVLIDKTGILQDPLSIMVGGYWIYEKAANLLPYDYYPE